MSNYRGKKSSDELDEVEELLRATEDAMVLKLCVDAHHTSRTSSLSSSSSSPLDDDLIRRFEALKAPSVSDKITSVPSRSGEKKNDGDAFARFSALKGGGSSVESNVNPGSEMAGKEEDEVEKLIQWAADAARLDPSLSDDEDVDSADDNISSDIDDDEDEEEEEHVKKKQSKNKKKKKEEKPVK